MSLLDHLVPAISGEAYGDRGLLDDLPLDVWLTSTIRPMTMNPTLGLVQSVYDPDKKQDRPARPEDFRYRVIVRDGQRRVERASLLTEKGQTSLRTGTGLFSSADSNLLPKIQHQAFASTASVDPKQNWRVERFSIGVGVGSLARVFVLYPALFIGGIYGLSKIANRAMPKGK